ncbi:hypothetical protein NIES3275_07260 [Microchaete diplosiphon NIES-3275]|nr:hypothetical protein NIES3275_07260 [Microchaete diplosiphon NIES-3275]
MQQIVEALALPCPLEYIDVSQTLFDLVLGTGQPLWGSQKSKAPKYISGLLPFSFWSQSCFYICIGISIKNSVPSPNVEIQLSCP